MVVFFEGLIIKEIYMDETNVFFEAFADMGVTRISDSSVWCDDGRKSRSKFADDLNNFDFVNRYNLSEYFKDGEGRQNISKAISAYKKSMADVRREQIESKISSIMGNEDTNFNMEDFRPVSLLNDGKSMLYNCVERKISCFDHDELLKNMDKDTKEEFLAKRFVAVAKYNPYTLDRTKIVGLEGQKVAEINTHNAPNWRYAPVPKSAACPADIYKVLRHMFPDDAVYEYVLSWMYHALTDRCETYLVLNGKKGLGKGILCALFRELVGKENYAEVPIGFLASTFNSVLDNKRVVSFDELKIAKPEHTKLKRYGNEDQNIEKKGIDADKSSEIFCSFIVSNNDIADMYLEWDDRRFSPVDISKTPIAEKINVQDIEDIVESFKDDEIMTQFGNYVLENGFVEKYNRFSDWKGPRFYEIVYSSLKLWERYIAKAVLEGVSPVINLTKLRKDYRKEAGKYAVFPVDLKTINGFLSTYKHEGRAELGEGIILNDEPVIEVSEEWLPKGEDLI